MKKIWVFLVILNISSAYAACPNLNSIYINSSDHFAAPDPFGTGKDWVDINETYGVKLPATNFWGATAVQVPREKEGIVSDFSCTYDAQEGRGFGLEAPDFYQKYQLDLSSSHWVILPNKQPHVKTNTIYICVNPKSVMDCPFTLVQ